jgi:phosphopantetheinyl transferase
MTIALVRCASDSRKGLHEAGKEAAGRAIFLACRDAERKVTPGQIFIEEDVLGRPRGRIHGDSSSVAVSISHAFPFALACAVADDIALGIDIERIRNFATNTREAFLTTAEKTIIANAPPKKKKYLPTLCWSLKESVLKALGTGLRVHPRQVDISRLLTDGCDSNVIGVKGVLYYAETGQWRINRDFIVTTVAMHRPLRL